MPVLLERILGVAGLLMLALGVILTVLFDLTAGRLFCGCGAILLARGLDTDGLEPLSDFVILDFCLSLFCAEASEIGMDIKLAATTSVANAVLLRNLFLILIFHSFYSFLPITCDSLYQNNLNPN